MARWNTSSWIIGLFIGVIGSGCKPTIQGIRNPSEVDSSATKTTSGPTTVTLTKNGAEDLPLTVTLPYTDPRGKLADSCDVRALSQVSLSSACACVSGVCSVVLQPAANFNGDASFEYQVTVGEEISNWSLVTLAIASVRDLSLSAPSAISVTSRFSHSFAGACDDSGSQVTITVSGSGGESASSTTSCAAGNWSTHVDVSLIPDGTLTVEAKYSSGDAATATATVSKSSGGCASPYTACATHMQKNDGTSLAAISEAGGTRHTSANGRFMAFASLRPSLYTDALGDSTGSIMLRDRLLALTYRVDANFPENVFGVSDDGTKILYHIRRHQNLSFSHLDPFSCSEIDGNPGVAYATESCTLQDADGTCLAWDDWNSNGLQEIEEFSSCTNNADYSVSYDTVNEIILRDRTGSRSQTLKSYASNVSISSSGWFMNESSSTTYWFTTETASSPTYNAGLSPDGTRVLLNESVQNTVNSSIPVATDNRTFNLLGLKLTYSPGSITSSETTLYTSSIFIDHVDGNQCPSSYAYQAPSHYLFVTSLSPDFTTMTVRHDLDVGYVEDPAGPTCDYPGPVTTYNNLTWP